MVKNEPTLAIRGVDTEENEHCEVCPLSVYRSPRYRMMVPCEVQIVQEEFTKPALRPGVPPTYYPFEVWRGSDLTCFSRDTHIVDVRINVPAKELVAGNPYQVRTRMNNIE